MKLRIDVNSALIIVDVQKDFSPGGSLPVPNGDEVVPVLNKYITKFIKKGARIYATRDWHPRNHISFQSRDGPWPSHCVQNTEGAEFHQDLELPAEVTIISKDSEKEAYSGFEDTHLAEDLQKQGIRRLFVGGLATEYCVRNTVLDALNRDYEVLLLEDAVRGVDIQDGASTIAITEMVKDGAKRVTLDHIVSDEG